MKPLVRLFLGAHPDRPDERDWSAEPILKASEKIDWTQNFALREPPDFNQKSSSSCVACAFSYYHWQLKGKVFSKRDLYARIYLPGGGAFLRSGALEIVKRGQCTDSEVPDPWKPTEQAMRITAGTDELRADDKLYHAFSVPNKLEDLAKSVRDYKGVVFGVRVSDEGWTNPNFPRPPKASELSNGHALYAFGYGKDKKGKYLLCKSSWCKKGQTTHTLYEDYLTQSFSAWALIPFVSAGMPPKGQVFQMDKTFGVFASDQETMKKLCDAANIPYTLTQEGGINFDAFDTIKVKKL